MPIPMPIKQEEMQRRKDYEMQDKGVNERSKQE